VDTLLLETRQSAGGGIPTEDTVAVTKSNTTTWQQWVQHPEKVWMRQLIFRLHLWLGVFVTAYVLVMSLSGCVIVFRNELSPVHLDRVARSFS
jgi:hypothetical protein